MKTYALRLKPGQDLKKELKEFTEINKLGAGIILTCVGSLKKAVLRLAGRKDPTMLEGPFEIVSLVGTLCQHSPHLHISISDKDGKTIGGHLIKEGTIIQTTAEIVIGELENTTFAREHDEETGYDELKISKN